MSRSKFSLVQRQCRENAGLTQKQVSECLNVERSTYAYYETGTTQPSCAFVLKVSKILGIDYRILVEAVADSDFDRNDEDESFTTFTSDSWKEREKMYTLKNSEQNIILAYRAISEKDKAKISENLKTMLRK